VWRRPEYFDEPASARSRWSGRQFDADPLARNGTGNGHDVPAMAGHAIAGQVQILDLDVNQC
jgi:hypothetical protein